MPYENYKAYNHSIHNRAGSNACRNIITMAEIGVQLLIGFFTGVILVKFFTQQRIKKVVLLVSAGGEVEITSRLDFITSKLDDIMNAQERLAKAIADLNEGTNDIAADLQALKDQITAGTVTPEALDQLDQNIAVLKQLGQQQ